ncbi:hypothetical protein PEC301879_20670 [Pectobacterium carotovorum subsp. carotovorum]|nr:hypothetical protein PEC301879_20670 [Pectobacterium carotovorum subsp. carotovorum]
MLISDQKYAMVVTAERFFMAFKVLSMVINRSIPFTLHVCWLYYQVLL